MRDLGEMMQDGADYSPQSVEGLSDKYYKY